MSGSRRRVFIESSGGQICLSGKDGVQEHSYWEHGLCVILIIHDLHFRVSAFLSSRKHEYIHFL